MELLKPALEEKKWGIALIQNFHVVEDKEILKEPDFQIFLLKKTHIVVLYFCFVFWIVKWQMSSINILL